MATGRGVIYVAVGDPAYCRQASMSIASLRASGYAGEVAVVTDSAGPLQGEAWCRPYWRDARTIVVANDADPFYSRAVKTRLHHYSPFEQSVYLDCDTLIVHPLESIWQHLGDGHVALARDRHRMLQQALSAAKKERRGSPAEWEATRACGDAPYFNAGVLVWRRSDESTRLFQAWEQQWRRFGGIDQFALARALFQCKLVPATLAARFNTPSHGLTDVVAAANAGVSVLHLWGSERKRMSELAHERVLDVYLRTPRNTAQ